MIGKMLRPSSASPPVSSNRQQQQLQQQQLQQQAREGERLADWFIAECLTPAFFADVWERRHFMWRAESLPNNRIGPKLIDPGVFAEMMCRVWAAGNLALFKEGSPVQVDAPPSIPEAGGSSSAEEGPPPAVWGALLRPYLSSASYILNQADRSLPLLSSFCKQLANLLFFHVFAVGYLTPPNSFTVNAHTDAQDVLLLQLWGCKDWGVYGFPRDLCLSSEMLGKKGPIEEARDNTLSLLSCVSFSFCDLGPPTKFTLNAGDVLYIPRGMAHKATTGSQGSLHITITIPTAEFSHERGRLASGVKAEEERREATKAMIDEITRHLSYESLLAASDAHAADLSEMQDTQFAVAQRTAAKPPLRWQSIVRVAEGIECSCADGAAEAIFRKGSATLRLPICHSASSLICTLSKGQKYQQRRIVAETLELNAVYFRLFKTHSKPATGGFRLQRYFCCCEGPRRTAVASEVACSAAVSSKLTWLVRRGRCHGRRRYFIRPTT
ncbi:hypothetical protein Esti_006380 [Eimeria stiedai]